MKVEFADKKIDASVLYAILEKHQLLSENMKDPRVCAFMADRTAIGFLHDGGDKPLAIILETYPEPGMINVLFITERARLNQRRNELINASLELRKRWFEDLKAWRVETRIPVERTQSIRCLRHMGFRIETMPKGLRNAALFNGKHSSVCVMGLLPSDPIKELCKPLSDPKLTDGEEEDAIH